MWSRVFCRKLDAESPAALLEALHALDLQVVGNFRGDELGWTAAELKLGDGTPIYVERYLTEADHLRDDLNTWAGYLETLDYSPHHVALMERVIQAQQLFTIRKPIDGPNESLVERLCSELSKRFAQLGEGIYQTEGEGWFAADGELLIREY